jgi:uncharacterized protein YodC (DUF2158 family)
VQVGKPLYKKLGLKSNFEITILYAPANYKALIGEIWDQLIFRNTHSGSLDFIHFFTNSIAELEETLPKLKYQIKKDGMIWVSWYKKSSNKKTALTENIIRDTALATGLVDVKVCSVTEEWSGLKLVFRLKDRSIH